MMHDSVALIHLHRAEPSAVLPALDHGLREWKYSRHSLVDVPEQGPKALSALAQLPANMLCYLLGPRRGNWLTIIQAFSATEETPFLADVANRLSQRLQTHSLALLLHEGVVLFYNLDYRGTPRDGYVSNPQFLAEETLTEAEILRQRHQPKAFTPLLPKDTKIEQLQELLNAGWWQAHDAKKLDATGAPLDEEDWISEEERLEQLGRLLHLNGTAGYPFAAWRDTRLLDWRRFKAVFYTTKSRGLPLV